MNASRTLSIAAVALLATFGAQAAQPANGNVLDFDFVEKAQSVKTRAEVQAEARQAIQSYQLVNQVDYGTNDVKSVKTRAEVQQHATDRTASDDLYKG